MAVEQPTENIDQTPRNCNLTKGSEFNCHIGGYLRNKMCRSIGCSDLGRRYSQLQRECRYVCTARQVESG